MRVSRHVVLVSILLTAQWAVAADAELCRAEPAIHANGSVLFESVLFTDMAKLEARLVDYKRHNPDCMMSFVMGQGTDFKLVGRVLLLIQEAGFGRVGFLTEPRNTP
jgi:hypothetical protein